MFKKLISILLSFTFITTQPVFAQGVAQLNMAQYLGSMPAVAADRFRPLHMRYLSYDAATDNFQLLLDKGDDQDIKVGNGRDRSLQEKTKVLMEYFQIGLALPNDKFWVNLRPDAEDQIIDPELEKTDMGKIMLESDLQLKKDTAGFTSPQTTEGRQYWDKLYKKAGELFGTENITIPTITRPWIVPGEIILRQGEDSAYIFKANMKVMLEHDYLSSQPSALSSQQYNFKDPRMKELNEYSSQLIRELIIPKLTKEVNTSKRYAALRQVFFSLVMARWFKDTFSGKPGQYSQLIDSHNLNNLTSKEAWSKTTYFNEYKKSFEKGEYNLKEDISTPTGQVIRSYVSGGITGSSSAMGKNITHNNGEHPLDVVNIFYKMPKGHNSGNLFLVKSIGDKTIVEIVSSNSPERPGKENIIKNEARAGSALMEAKPAEFFSFEESEELRKNLEQNMWVRVEDIKTILSNALNSIDVNNDAFPNIRKDINSILMYLNIFNNRDARIKGKDIDEIVEILYKKGTSSEKSLFDILPKGYKVWSGGRSVTLSGSVSELRRFQEAWEKLEIDAEAVVKRIVGQTGAASEKYVKYIVERFREKIDRNPTMQETGEIIGYVIQNHKGNESLPEIVDEKIAEIMASSSMETISKSVPKNAGGIDFRTMNYLVQPMGSFKDLRFGLPTLTSSALERIDLDKELDSLRDMVKAGMVPSGMRVKEYLAACFQKGKIEEKQDDLLVCLAEIYRLAEEENLETSPELRESLVIVDTGKFVLMPNNQKVGLS
ncbi:MAG: hypothetical protein Q7J72_00715 [Candidatus Omnitrophota bacterium]|nr:hypothetical protein [Candidatus Omnitrophota bacterium]